MSPIYAWHSFNHIAILSLCQLLAQFISNYYVVIINLLTNINEFCFQLKEWGFLCRDVFGAGLGSGDYGHLIIDHAEQLLRKFRSMREYSNQGFESLHKLQRLLYARATNHDQAGPGSSSMYFFYCHNLYVIL